MPSIDREAAKAAGYTDAEIDAYEGVQASMAAPSTPGWGNMGGPGLAFLASAAQRLGRAGSRLTYQDEPFAESPGLDSAHPIAVGAGQAVPAMATAAVPGGVLAQAGMGAISGALLEDDPTRGALIGGVLGGAGAAAGNMAARVASGIKAAAKGVSRRLSSGVRITTGEALQSPVLMAAEQSAARNAVTGRPFAGIARQNRELLHGKVLAWLGKSGKEVTESVLDDVQEEAIGLIRRAVPDDAVIDISSGGLTQKFDLLGKSGEAMELPQGATLSGKMYRTLRTDLNRATKSLSANVRERAREAIEMLDDAAEKVPEIDSATFRQGRSLYRKLETLDAPGVLKQAPGTGEGVLDFNRASLQRSLKKNFGKRARFNAGRIEDRAGAELVQVVKDLGRTRDFTSGSITSTGVSVPVVAADLVATGGIGTLSALGLSELSQSPGIAGALLPQPGGSAVGGALGRLLATQVPEDDEE